MAGSARHSLRRDGARPLKFDGTLLIRLVHCTPTATKDRLDGPPHGGCEDAGPLQTFELFQATDGSIIGAIRMEPTEQLKSRPVHLARRIAGPLDLAAFLDEYDPVRTPGADARQAAALEADFARMIEASALRVAPTDTGYAS